MKLIAHAFALARSYYLGGLLTCLAFLLLLAGSGGTLLLFLALSALFMWSASRSAATTTKPRGRFGVFVVLLVLCWPGALYYAWTRRLA